LVWPPEGMPVPVSQLNVFPIRLPALREREEDIPTLAWHFAANYARRMNKKIEMIKPLDMEVLCNMTGPATFVSYRTAWNGALCFRPIRCFARPCLRRIETVRRRRMPAATPGLLNVRRCCCSVGTCSRRAATRPVFSFTRNQTQWENHRRKMRAPMKRFLVADGHPGIRTMIRNLIEEQDC
jgi:hypothetical protein